MQLHFIPYLHSDIIPIFEASLRRSNTVVQMSHQLPHLNLPIVDRPRYSNMFRLSNTGSGLDLVNLYHHQSVVERHPKLVFKFAYLEDLDAVDPFNVSVVDGGK